MTMTGDDGFIDILYVVDEVGDLFAVLVGQAVAGGIRDIDDRGAGGDNGFDHAGEVGILGTSCVLGIEFDVAHQVAGPFYGLDGPLQDLVACSVEFTLDMKVRSTDAGMDTGSFGVLQG